MKCIWTAAVLTALTPLGFVAETRAEGVPYESQVTTNGFYERSATIVVSPRLHPEVEVSRSLSAQPVHPHMVKVILGGDIRPNTSGAAQHTWIDPLRRLDGENGLDENHSLVKAQRLYLSLSGVTQKEMDAHRIRSHRLQRDYADQSRARIVVNPHARSHDDGSMQPVMVVPRPATAPMPSVPKNPRDEAPAEDDKPIADADADETIAEADAETVQTTTDTATN